MNTNSVPDHSMNRTPTIELLMLANGCGEQFFGTAEHGGMKR